MPRTLKDLNCSHNQITNLEYFPQYIKNIIWKSNPLISLSYSLNNNVNN